MCHCRACRCRPRPGPSVRPGCNPSAGARPKVQRQDRGARPDCYRAGAPTHPRQLEVEEWQNRQRSPKLGGPFEISLIWNDELFRSRHSRKPRADCVQMPIQFVAELARFRWLLRGEIALLGRIRRETVEFVSIVFEE